jgi:ariadne-1
MESPEQVLKASGETVSPLGPPSKRQRMTTEAFVCDICCDTPSELDVYKERCGHKYCRSCWRAYIVGKVKDEGQCTVPCMQEECQTVIASNLVKDLVDPQCYERYFIPFY